MVIDYLTIVVFMVAGISISHPEDKVYEGGGVNTEINFQLPFRFRVGRIDISPAKAL